MEGRRGRVNGKRHGKLRRRIFLRKDDLRRFGTGLSDCLRGRHPFAGTVFRNLLFSYFFGERFGRRYYPEIAERAAEPHTLYHLTYSSLLPAILEEGLKARDMLFLTDDPGYGEHYFRWKESRAAVPEGDRIILKIDTTELLRSGHPICALKKKSEYITDFVPPGFIASVSGYRDAPDRGENG